MSRPSRIVLLGVGQGARTAGHLLARHPDRFVGAILLAPTGFEKPDLPASPTATAGPDRPVVIVVTGASGSSRSKSDARKYAAWFDRAGATVHTASAAGMDDGWPDDFDARIEDWFATIANRPE